MSDQHTQGPWFVHQLPNHEQTGRMWPISANNDPGSALAYVGLEGQPNLANARLMAAAPELLTMLKRALGGLEDWDRDQREYHPESVDGWKLREDIEAVIAKAEGRQP